MADQYISNLQQLKGIALDGGNRDSWSTGSKYFSDVLTKIKIKNSLEIYEGVMILKQGVYNYKYVAKTPESIIYNAISGSHATTENRYLIFVYYRYFGNLYDSLIGIGETSSFEIID